MNEQLNAIWTDPDGNAIAVGGNGVILSGDYSWRFSPENYGFMFAAVWSLGKFQERDLYCRYWRNDPSLSTKAITIEWAEELGIRGVVFRSK